MQFPVTLQFQPSRRLRAALVFVHLAAFSAALTQGIPLAVLVAPVLGLSLVWIWRSIRVPKLTICEDGSLMWQISEPDPVAGCVLSGTAFSWLVVLRIRLETGRAVVLVAVADSLKPAEFRRLQIWLRWVVPIKSAASSA